jgi:1-phosphatidylinositol phosphodiesterase
VLLAFSGTALCFAASPEIGGCNWMSVIDDSTSLADISMPGTHDSAATYLAFGIKARCQDKTIPAQLNCGVRFLDIRLCAKKNKLKSVHNFIDCRKGSGFTAPRLYLDDILAYCSDFLSKNEKECIVLFVKDYCILGKCLISACIDINIV